MPVEAFVTPAVLRWARERDKATKDEAAQRLGVDTARLDAWERGESRPTFRQAEHLAQHFNVPFGYLFLSGPPTEHLPLPDLRTIGDQPTAHPSPELLDAIAEAMEKQAWFRDYQESEGATPLSFIGSLSLKDSAESIGTVIGQYLGMDADVRGEAHSWEEFLRLFVTRVEAAGILVLRNGVVGSNTHRPLDVDEFRGFAIADELAPLVFLNARDARAAQIFTLAHELAHLWIGVSGVSNPNYRKSAEQQGNLVERLCNRAAAEMLLPRGQFLTEWNRRQVDIMDRVRAIASAFRVSRVVALRQALDLELIQPATYWYLYDRMLAEAPRSASSGGDFYRTLLSRNSPTLVRAAMSSMDEGRTSYMETAQLLNVRAASLDSIKRRVLA